MEKFDRGDRVEFNTDYYGNDALDSGVGTILRDWTCDSPTCCTGGLWEVKVQGHDLTGIYEDHELTKID